MKQIKNIIISCVAFSTLLCGCSDYLDREPLSQGTEAIFFKTADHFNQAANAIYNLEGWKNYNGAVNDFWDKGLDISGVTSNGGGSAGEGDYRWNKPYEYLRTINILLEKAEEYTGNKDEIAQPIGTAYFFRAWQHFYLLRTFGGVPVVDHPLDVSDEVVKGPRNSRYEVVNLIINDLRNAIPLLPKESAISASDKGKISKEAAKAFLGRVLLYEATWEKYAGSIGYDLDGDGTSTGAGKAKPAGYPSVTDMLTEAKKMSKEVIDEAETGTFELWNECDSLSYYYLFNLDDKGGNVSNFKGVGKATNKEFILSAKYDYDVKRGGINLGHIVASRQGVMLSASFGESFLCRNGLPIRVSYTGNMADAQNNPDFLGFTHFNDEFRNRDYRFIGSIYMPDRVSWMANTAYGIPNTAIGDPYPEPVYPQSPYNPQDPAFASKVAIYNPTLYGGTHFGYVGRKYLPEGSGRSTTDTESADYPLLRLAEVHLIYAEATCELNNGQISDADLDFSINKNRARAGVAPLTNALIANVWDAGYWDHEQAKTICKKMNMLDEIRRERACELFGEGFRLDDLKRWGIAHINLTGQKLGSFVYGTEYMTATANDAAHYGEPCYQPDKHPLTYGVYESNPSDPDHGRSITNIPANLLYSKRDYLAPIPLGQIRLNPSLTQNPDW